MKATGIVRKIDDLGRLVLPKELRRTMGIKKGDPIEIYIGDKGQIVLKKYDPIPQALEQISNLEELIMDDNTCTPEAAGKAINLLKEVKQLFMEGK